MGYVYNEHLDQATGEHFNSKGHLVADMEVTILEKIFSRVRPLRRKYDTYKENCPGSSIQKIR